MCKLYSKRSEKFSNADTIYTTCFKDVFEKSDNRKDLIEYFRSEMELVYKRTTIGSKGDDFDSYTEQEKLDAQTCYIIRQIVRPLMPEIDSMAGHYFDKYQEQ